MPIPRPILVIDAPFAYQWWGGEPLAYAPQQVQMHVQQASEALRLLAAHCGGRAVVLCPPQELQPVVQVVDPRVLEGYLLARLDLASAVFAVAGGTARGSRRAEQNRTPVVVSLAEVEEWLRAYVNR